MRTTKSSQHPGSDQLQLDMLQLVDAYKECKNLTAFLSTAFVAVMAEDRADDSVIDGAQQCAESLRTKISALEIIIEQMPDRLSQVLGANDEQH